MKSKINFQDDDEDSDQAVKNGKLIKEEKMRKGIVCSIICANFADKLFKNI